MIKAAALSASLCLLAACATPSSPPRVELAEPLPDIRPDPRLCADLKPEPPVLGSIVQPVTPAEREATGQFLEGEAAARDWGREGWARAAVAKQACPR